MNPGHIAEKRLTSQLLTENDCKTPGEIVQRMGAIQAQDLPMALWAVGIRLENSTEKSVKKSFDRGEIIRAHLLRPTWHFVHADDIRWMIGISAPQIKASMVSRHRQLELDDRAINKSNDVIVNTFADKKYATRNDLVTNLESAGFIMKDNRAAHLLMLAELEGLICSGEIRTNKQTYALLDDRVPKKESLSRDEALERLARKYFRSHGPATAADFSWWSGLPVREAERTIDILRLELHYQKAGTKTYWFTDPDPYVKKGGDELYMLPAYDEFIISYKDRSASVRNGDNRRTVSDNGMFWPVILEKGLVKGTWKRKILNNRLTVEMNFFQFPGSEVKHLVDEEVKAYAKFMGMKAEWAFKE